MIVVRMRNDKRLIDRKKAMGDMISCSIGMMRLACVSFGVGVIVFCNASAPWLAVILLP